MTEPQPQALLNDLIARREDEVVEFKRAGYDYSTDRIGQYFAALPNEANLRGLACAWLVFGIDNKRRAVVGTDSRPKSDRLQGLKHQISENTQLSEALTDEQKDHKVANLLTNLRRRGQIRNAGTRGQPRWTLEE